MIKNGVCGLLLVCVLAQAQNASGAELLRTVTASGGEVTALDGMGQNVLAASGSNAFVLDGSGNVLKSFYGSPRRIRLLHSNSKTMYALDQKNTLTLWDFATRQKLKNIDIAALLWNKGLYATQLAAFSQNGRYIAFKAQDVFLDRYQLAVYDNQSHTISHTIPSFYDFTGLAFVNDDTEIAISEGRDVLLVNLNEKRIRATYTEAVPIVALSGQGTQVLTTHAGGVRAWDVEEGKLLHDVSVEGVTRGMLSPKGDKALLAVGDASALYDFASKTRDLIPLDSSEYALFGDNIWAIDPLSRELNSNMGQQLSLPSDRSSKIKISASGQFAVLSEKLNVYNKNAQNIMQLTGVQDMVWQAEALYTAQFNNVQLYENASLQQSYPLSSENIQNVAVLSDEVVALSRVFSGASEVLQLYRAQDNQKLLRIAALQGNILSTALNQKNIVAGASDGVARVFGIKDGKRVQAVSMALPIEEVKISNNSQYIATRSGKELWLWGLASGKVVLKLSDVTGFAFNSSSTMLATTSSQKTLNLYNPSNKKLLKSWTGLSSAENIDLAFSPEGKYLFVGTGQAKSGGSISIYGAKNGATPFK